MAFQQGSWVQSAKEARLIDFGTHAAEIRLRLIMENGRVCIP